MRGKSIQDLILVAVCILIAAAAAGTLVVFVLAAFGITLPFLSLAHLIWGVVGVILLVTVVAFVSIAVDFLRSW